MFFDLKPILVIFLLVDILVWPKEKLFVKPLLLTAYNSVDNRVWLLENRLFIAMRPVGVYIFLLHKKPRLYRRRLKRLLFESAW